MNTPDTAPYEVWRATDDGAECVATTTNRTEAHDQMRKRGDAIVLRGDVTAVKYGLHAGLRRTIAHVAKFAPRDASGALIQTTTPTPPAEEVPAVHEDPVKTKDKGPEIAPPPCTAKDCDQPCERVRADTQPALANLCPHDRSLAHGRARDWGLSLDAAAQTLRDGVTERPSEAVPSRRGHRDPKPSKRSQSAKKVPTKTARKVAKAKASKPRVTPSQSPKGLLSVTFVPTDHAVIERVTRALAVVQTLGGIERAEKIAEAHAFGGGA